MFLTTMVLATLGIGPPVWYPGGADLTDLQGASFSWSFQDRASSFGFGSNEFGDWSFGEVRVRQPLVEVPVPRTYSGGGVFLEGAPLIEVPVRRGWWPRRQKIKFKVKNRSW